MSTSRGDTRTGGVVQVLQVLEWRKASAAPHKDNPDRVGASASPIRSVLGRPISLPLSHLAFLPQTVHGQRGDESLNCDPRGKSNPQS